MAKQRGTFTPKQARTIVTGVKRALSIPFGSAPDADGPGSIGRRPTRAKITAVTVVSGKRRYTLECGYWNGATNTTTGGTWTAITMPGNAYGFAHIEDCLQIGAYVFIQHDYIDASTGNNYFSIVGRHAGVLFPVDVVKTSGSSGSSTTACSYLYTVKDLAGGTLTTGAAPIWARPALGVTLQATHGIAYFTAAGAVVLYQVDEQPDMEAC
jgi:hypothetical protein